MNELVFLAGFALGLVLVVAPAALLYAHGERVRAERAVDEQWGELRR